MSTPSQTFDTHINNFKEIQEAPWGRLRYTIATENINNQLANHFPDKNLKILDIGGGNGLDAIPLAKRGHRIIVLDYSAEMLAEGEENVRKHGLSDQITFQHADITAIPKTFPEPRFDLVLCHNVIQYVDDPARALKTMYDVLMLGGLISLISINRYSETFRRALQQLDPVRAIDSLGATAYQAVVFHTEMRVYSSEEMAHILKNTGFSSINEYGIRCITDYIANNEIKYNPDFFSALEKLELALTDQHPYRLIARNYQIIARKK